MTRSPRRALFCLLAVSLLVLILAPFLGRPVIAPARLLSGAEGLDGVLFWRWRLPRVLAAFLAGVALASGGVVFQAVFRNALATPFTLGISGGASLGAALASQALTGTALPGVGVLQGAAFAGALLSVVLVQGLSRIRRNVSTSDLLLAGVAVSFLFSSLIMLLQTVGDPGQSLRLLHWMMGGIFVTGIGALVPLALPVAAGSLLLFALARELDLLLLGEDLAFSRGLDARRLRRLLFAVVSVMVGACVAICGPIGFVGLMIPHGCRRVFGARHRWLLPASALAGGALLALCDTLARTAVAPAEIPVGVITALLGAPFFLWLLYTGRTDL